MTPKVGFTVFENHILLLKVFHVSRTFCFFSNFESFEVTRHLVKRLRFVLSFSIGLKLRYMLLISCKTVIISLLLQNKLLLYPLILLLNNIELFTSVLYVFCRNFFAEVSVSNANFIITRVLFENFVINLIAHILFKHVLLGMHLLLLSDLHIVVGFKLLFACAIKLLNGYIFLLLLESVL